MKWIALQEIIEHKTTYLMTASDPGKWEVSKCDFELTQSEAWHPVVSQNTTSLFENTDF